MKQIIKNLKLLPYIFLLYLRTYAAEGDTKFEGPSTTAEVFAVFKKILDWFLGIAIVLGVVFIIYAGITFMTAGGDPTKVKDAKKRLIFAIIGVAIVLVAKGIVALIVDFLGAAGAPDESQIQFQISPKIRIDSSAQ